MINFKPKTLKRPADYTIRFYDVLVILRERDVRGKAKLILSSAREKTFNCNRLQ